MPILRVLVQLPLLAASAMLVGCAALWKPEPLADVEASPTQVKIDADWVHQPPVNPKGDVFAPQPIPSSLHEHLAKKQASRQPTTPPAATSAPEVSTVSFASPPTATTPPEPAPPRMASAPPALLPASPTAPRPSLLPPSTAAAPRVVPSVEAPLPAATTVVSRGAPNSKTAPLTGAVQLKGLVEDVTGATVAWLQITDVGRQRARVGDMLVIPFQGRDTSMRVANIENGQVLLQDVDSGQTLIVR